ncbi:hypothetical protein, partial [Desulfobacula sp.]|uniref:hypothetical protein n=1 Tax=Desulfobacula sp. TaxID=2593537 RepID=UPI0039B9C487
MDYKKKENSDASILINGNFKKNDKINFDLISLSEKKNICIVAYNKYKSNEITKEDYKREFKRFTWWI